MKVVKVEILPMNAGEVVTGTIKVEGGKSEGYENSVESGTPQASQTLILNDDQRVVIEGKVEDEVQFDLDQRAAKKVPLGEKAEEQKKKDKEQDERSEKMQKDEEQRLEKEMPEEAKLRASQQKAQNEKVMGKQDEKKHPGEGDPNYRPDFLPPQNMAKSNEGLRHETPADSKTVKEEAPHTGRSRR
jgi:hypothetical protein